MKTKQYNRKFMKGINTWVVPCKILWTILEVDQRRT